MLHGALGVKAEDFLPMKEALLWALVHTPNIEISEEEEEAWAAGYDVLMRSMLGGVDNWHMQESEDETPDNLEPG